MAFTRHGHEVDHGPLEQHPGLTARCGGPGLCSECSRDAARPAPEPEIVTLLAPQAHPDPIVSYKLTEDTSRPRVLVDSEYHNRAVRALSLLQDLDRCEHGRHRGNPCYGCAALPGAQGGLSHGNPITGMWSGMRIGFDHGGNSIVVPPLDKRHDPQAWVLRIEQ